MNVLVFSTLSIWILLPTVTTAGAGHPLKIRVYDNVFFHYSAAVGPLPSSADLESSICNMLQAQYNIDLSTCVQSLTASIVKGRTAVQENLSPAGIRLGLGTVANCLYHNMTTSPCNAYYTHEAEWEYTTLSGQTITKDDVLFLMDRLYEFGQLGSSKLCENCGGLFSQTKFRGIPIQSTPNDLFILQEIIHEHSPDVIIETGTASGGSAIFYATHLGSTGLVITIDINGVTDGCVLIASPSCKKAQDHHMWESKVQSLTGRSDDPLIHQQVGELLEAWTILHGRKPRVMMSLDGPHLCELVYTELIGLGDYVTKNQYIVVQDTKMDHQYLHWIDADYYGGNGPLCAIKKFFDFKSLLSKSFVVDRRRELFGSQHQQGWLLKV